MTPGATLEFQLHFASGLSNRGAPNTAKFLSVAAEGYAIYTRNVRLSLVAALGNTFTVTRRLVGSECFESMANAFVTDHLPNLGWLWAYGSEFPNFVASYAPAHALRYLPDIARLEWARVRAANCPDDPGLDLRTLVAFGSHQLAALTLNLHGAASLICSAFPVGDIWRIHRQTDRDDTVEPLDLTIGSQSVLVTRPGPLDVAVTLLQRGDTALVSSVARHAAFGDAWRAAELADRDYDLRSRLSVLVQSRAFAGIAMPKGLSMVGDIRSLL